MKSLNIAIVGASSQIARDLIISIGKEGLLNLLLYVRDVSCTISWLRKVGLNGINCSVHEYAEYGYLPHDVVINFVGVGDPRRAIEMGASIFDVTLKFDDLVMKQLHAHPERRYMFLSSGAVYGSSFDCPVNASSESRIPINAISPQDYYSVAKLYAEARHRAHPDLAIIDIRVFNYISRTQNLNARFFITDILRAIRDDQVLITNSSNMVRDYIHPSDFFQLFKCLLEGEPVNGVVDCYSGEPIEKLKLLKEMSERFGLKYKIEASESSIINATNSKKCYYSKNHKAASFGYIPQLTSWDGISIESTEILNAEKKFDAYGGGI